MKERILCIKDIVEKGTLSCNVSLTYQFLKRFFDIFVSILGMVILSPVFIFVTIAIKFDSVGPVIYSQERYGLKGKKFKIYKFRSMVVDAERLQKDLKNKNEIEGCMFKIKNDPRVTKVGRIIRKTSIDELPQLFNVIKGDMSIVGPRPPIMTEIDEYETWYKLRMSVKPGITGLWQIKGRNDVGFEEMVRLDLKYIRERGFWYDMKIILYTIPLLLGDKRAF